MKPAILFALTFCQAVAGEVTFHSTVLPILEQHCQKCHRAGEIAPMAFETYAQTRPWASAIQEQSVLRRMPPWFAAAPANAHFANDPSLTEAEIETLREWAATGAQEGTPDPSHKPAHWEQGWNIARPDVVFTMPQPFALPASGAVEYQYFVLPTGFTEDRWVQSAEIRPQARANVHHVVVYVRNPQSTFLRDGTAVIPPKTDILLIYTPGNEPARWAEGMAKKVEAGSDLVFQIHYTTNGTLATDQTRIGLVFSKTQPAQRVLTLQMGNSAFRIPPGDPNFPVLVRGTLPRDATLLSLFPHMHLRGKGFEYRIIPPRGPAQVLLRVQPYDFYWQLNYILSKPLMLAAGTKFEWEARFDNSANNPRNPDPAQWVSYGEQSWQEMMIGFFEVAVPANTTKEQFFERGQTVRSNRLPYKHSD
ncbi:MAG: thiol-disulfide isomerase [Acidobacteriota bacterium]|nr:thiol-disulfide isomerase [Acidobacteriota bacterium]